MDKMVKSVTRNISFVAIFLTVLCALACANPISKSKADTLQVSESDEGRTIMSSASNLMKDMFDWSTVTWVPLGSLIFGKTDESLGFAKWPTKNNNNNGK